MPENLYIRPSTSADLTDLDAMFARSYPKLLKPDYPPSVLVTALPLISRAQPRLVTTGTYYVAELDGAGIVGAGGWTRQAGAVADIRHVVTDMRYLRRGVGRALLERIFAEARAAGVRLLECNSTRTAVPFYASVGFVELGPIEINLRAGISFPAVHMQRQL